MASSASLTRVVRWGVRIWGTGVALFWGAFFIEHLNWFAPGREIAPLRVWLLQGLLGLVVLTLICGWRYERVGGTLALLASIVFFVAVAGSRAWLFSFFPHHGRRLHLLRHAIRSAGTNARFDMTTTRRRDICMTTMPDSLTTS
jgi:hypothetical protein